MSEAPVLFAISCGWPNSGREISPDAPRWKEVFCAGASGQTLVKVPARYHTRDLILSRKKLWRVPWKPNAGYAAGHLRRR